VAIGNNIYKVSLINERMVVGRIYGIAAILLALDAMFSHILGQLLPVLVVALGVLILLTPMGGGPMGYQTTSQKIRRYVFGIFIGIIGLVPIIQNYTGSFYIPVVSGSIEILPWASVEVWTGQVILILIGVIYFFAGTKAGNAPIWTH